VNADGHASATPSGATAATPPVGAKLLTACSTCKPVSILIEYRFIFTFWRTQKHYKKYASAIFMLDNNRAPTK
jgi:hypothetical protein